MPSIGRVRNRRLVRGPLALAVLVGLSATSLSVPAAQAHPAAVASPGTRSGTTVSAADAARLARQASAHRALAQVRRVLAPKTPAAAQAQLHSSRDATMALRNAWAQRDSMTPADRAAFKRADARPAETNVKCSDVICVHWTPGETKTTFANLVLKTVTHIHKTYVRAGYRGPKPDGTLGGNAKTDVYLSDIGGTGLYGYCTSDQNQLVAPGRYDVWAFCVLDNNFSHAEFPSNTPVENMQVTAAHEYFHANQFAYDILDDRWFLESTAVWVEDQMYTKVNDNLQYLAQSPLTQPGDSLDNNDPDAQVYYGRWIFMRYLTEHFTKRKGFLPQLILQFWQAADSSHGRKQKNLYSLQAISKVLKQKGTSLPKQLAKFADGNLRPAKTYREGAANHYPGAPLSPFTLKPGHLSQGGEVKLDHLSSASAALVPQGLAAAGWKLRVHLDLGRRVTSPQAVVTTYLKNGKTITKLVQLTPAGNATVVTPFSSNRIRGVAVTLVNGSTRLVCHRRTNFSCAGNPLDQDVPDSFTATAFR